MDFAIGMMIGQLLRWMVRQLFKVWWIFAALIIASVIGQLLGRVGVPISIAIPVTWITAAFFMVYLRKLAKEKREAQAQMPRTPWDNQ